MNENSPAGNDANREPKQFFVYGTLKSDQCRRACWPAKPLKIRKACTPGMLVDLGEYPALIEGQTPVWGEVWSFRASQVASVCAVLDEIECYVPGRSDNLYDRVIGTVQIYGTEEAVGGSKELAWMYRYSQDLSGAPEATKVTRAGVNGYHWP